MFFLKYFCWRRSYWVKMPPFPVPISVSFKKVLDAMSISSWILTTNYYAGFYKTVHLWTTGVLSILQKQFLFHGVYPFVPASRSVALLGCTSVLPLCQLLASPGAVWLGSEGFPPCWRVARWWRATKGILLLLTPNYDCLAVVQHASVIRQAAAAVITHPKLISAQSAKCLLYCSLWKKIKTLQDFHLT